MKRRIFLGLLPLFLLLVAMGVYAVVLFAKLGDRVEIILRENFRSVLAGQEMKETAERMDSALFFSLAGEEAQGRALYAQNLPGFERGLSTELGNITLPGEGALARKIEKLHEKYAERADAFWATHEPEERRKMYFAEMLPAFTAIKDGAQEVIRMNQDNMLEADRNARALSEKSTRTMIIALILGLGGALFLAVRLQRSILQPIRALTIASKDFGEGKLDQIVPVTSNDELGQLAATFNKMAGKLRAYRQAMGDQVLRARQMMEITFSAFPDPIIALSEDGRIDFTNAAAQRFLAALGLPGGLPREVNIQAERVCQGAPDFLPASFDHVLAFQIDDREVIMLPRVIGIRDEAGHLFGAAVILQDVTRLRLLDEVKSNLVSTVSHELKTPLTSVRMGLHLLLEERIGSLNDKQTELLLAAREDSERLLRMINDLLDLAQLEAGARQPSIATLTPAALVASTEEDLRELAESRGAKLVIEIAENLPSVSVDRQQLGHVFTNLVSNAAKHTTQGREIELRVRAHGPGVRFSVVDHGPGISRQYQAHVFDRFFRVPDSATSGAGLGLAIAKEIVQAQGGNIGVSSAPGEGSEFYFDLPAATSAAIA